LQAEQIADEVFDFAEQNRIDDVLVLALPHGAVALLLLFLLLLLALLLLVAFRGLLKFIFRISFGRNLRTKFIWASNMI
jgi:hypothetical protein